MNNPDTPARIQLPSKTSLDRNVDCDSSVNPHRLRQESTPSVYARTPVAESSPLPRYSFPITTFPRLQASNDSTPGVPGSCQRTGNPKCCAATKDGLTMLGGP